MKTFMPPPADERGEVGGGPSVAASSRARRTWTQSELVSELQGAVASYVGLEPADVDPERPIDELGMDSLTAAQLAVDIEDRLGVSVFLNDLSGKETIAELAASVLREREP